MWVATRFPPRRSGDDLADLTERLGGAASRPRLEPCRVCHRLVWASDLHAHRACLEADGMTGLGYAPPEPDRPAPIVGMVYESRRPDSHASQVSDATGRANDRAAAEAVDRMPRCERCGRPITTGLRRTHFSCRDDTGTDPTTEGMVK